MNLEKELARKLAWAVISSINPPDAIKRRIRVWAWRVACKMVGAKSQFTLTNPLPPPDNGMAGGGADRVQKRIAPPTRSAATLEEAYVASTAHTGPTAVRSREGGTGDRRGSGPKTCSSGSCRWRSGSRCVRRPAGSDYRWRRPIPQETAPAGADIGRHENRIDDSECYLEKGG